MKIVAADQALSQPRGARGDATVTGDALYFLVSPRGPMQKVVNQIHEVADTSLSVLLEGESGTGKELASKAVHALSARRDKPLVAVDCGGIPDTLIESELFGFERGAFTGAVQRKKGQFQLADGGTLFLDEIQNLPFPTQTKLLRALQERRVRPLGSDHPVPFHVRIVAASQCPLKDEVRAGRFRADLYYRINEFQIDLPPLRDREDLLDLAREFAAEACREFDRPECVMSDEATSVLLQHRWPGNVRELRNVIRRSVLVSARTIGPEHLCLTSPAAPPRDGPGRGSEYDEADSLKSIVAAAVARAEAQAVEAALSATLGNKSQAARLLQIDYKTLLGKLKRYEVDARRFKRAAQDTP